MRLLRSLILLAVLSSASNLGSVQATTCTGNWIVTPITTSSGLEWQISYGSGIDYPQYAVLHDSSFLRLNVGPSTGWGTSIIVFPIYWSGGVRSQLHHVQTVSTSTVGCDLNISLTGTASALNITGQISFAPPIANHLRATIGITVLNPSSVDLDTRMGEAFMPLFLSSMHISDTQWDAREAFAENDKYQIPVDGWLISPEQNVFANRFGLIGGTSSWKMNAPTISVKFANLLQIAGWKRASSDPNDDNLGVWASTADVLPSWSALVTAFLEQATPGIFRPSTSTFLLRRTNSTGSAESAVAFGQIADMPVAGDWNGDRVDTVGVYRNGQFLLLEENATGAPVVYQFTLGNPTDIPIAGDWDGNGRDSVGVYHPSNRTFYLRNTLNGGVANVTIFTPFALPGDIPVAGDWNGDGIHSPGLFRPATAQFFLTNRFVTGTAQLDRLLTFGLPGDLPISGDWDNDGRDGIGVFRNGQIFLRNRVVSGPADITFSFGMLGDRPFVGRWGAPSG